MSPQRITIHQFHYSTSRADAVTNHMRLIRESLSEVGVGGEIFAVENKAPVEFGIQKFRPAKLWNADLLLIHHSHGNPQLRSVLKVEIPKALVYHNVTPPEFFSHDRYLADLCRLGRDQLGLLKEKVVASFAVSEVNAGELRALGFDPVSLFPLVDLADVSATASAADRSQHTLLFVGKATPHKNQKLLIETLFYLEQAFPGRYRLRLVGRGDALYGKYLRDLTQVLGLQGAVDFCGAVSEAQLSQEYARASALVCASLHEGFCVPLVEAMRAGLPILALPIPGVRQTLGEAGVRVMTRKPHRLAAVIDSVLSDAATPDQIRAGQYQRYAELREFQNREKIRELCQGLVQRLRSRSPVTRLQKPTWFPLFRRVQKPA